MKRRDLLVGATGGVVAGAAAVSLSMGGREPVADGGSLSTPAINRDRVEITMVSTWPRDFPGMGVGAQRFAGLLGAMTDGRLQVSYYAGGERVGAFDSFDEVASGNAQMYHSADYYWKGKHPGWAYFATVPFGLSYAEMTAWMDWMGGQELWDELADGFGMKCLPCGNSGVQWAGWFNKEIDSPDDLRGLKMRIPGIGGDVMSKLGVSTVSLPGAQIYENLASGAIDATEWVGPWNDEAMKFYETAKYYYYPGMHEPATQLSLGINASFWGELAESDRQLIASAASSENSRIYNEYNARNGAALERLQKDQGVQVRKFSRDVFSAFGWAAEEVFAEVVEHSDLARRIHESMLNARRIVGSYQQFADVEYINQRNAILGG